MQPTLNQAGVRAWPQDVLLAVQELRSAQALTVISVPTPLTTNRVMARSLIRTALRGTLGALLDQPAASIALVSHPGEPIRVNSAPVCLCLSISHSPGLSVAAIYRGVSIGTDVMHIEAGRPEQPDWINVARDYLGPQVTALLQTTPSSNLPVAFAQAWTRFEACLKCLGLAVTEWSPELGAQLASCRVGTLDLPDNYVGTVAAGDLARNW